VGVRTIHSLGDFVLRQKARPVRDFDRSLVRLLEDMTDTMYKFQGIGLAANQIGILRRVIVIDVGCGLHALINPEIVEGTGSRETVEGCLSVPGKRLWVRRYQRVVVRARSRCDAPVTLEASDLLARCLQHEIDHLDGVLIVDHQVAPPERKEVAYAEYQHA